MGEETLSALAVWRESLVGLERRSPLIRFRQAKTSSLKIDQPDADEIFERIQSRQLQELVGDVEDPISGKPKPARGGKLLHVSRPDNELGPVTRNLMRNANEKFLERGLSVLYVAFGLLKWNDVDGSEMVSPIYLVPVSLIPEGPKAVPKLSLGEDEPVLNPALALRLADYGISLPTTEEVEGMNITDILAVVRRSLLKSKEFNAWILEPEVHLSSFTFNKEAMYNDLKNNESVISENPIIQALATTDPKNQLDCFQFDPIDPSDIDEKAPPEKVPLVLDADSSQRVAISAALAGRSFVMDGPPGSGKSQTISNMIGALLHAGKTVLFVSEKIAALDVVRNRLLKAGLGSYLLELHSHKANRKDVASELLNGLDYAAQTSRGMPEPSVAALEDRRRRLNAYASAMNEIRSPLEATLHDIIGLLSHLTDLPSAPPPTRPVQDLDEASLTDLKYALKRLERNWGTVSKGRNSVWRGIEDETPMDSRIWIARKELEGLQEKMQANESVMAAFELDGPSRARDLLELLEYQQFRQEQLIPDELLTSNDWSLIQSDKKMLCDLVGEYLEHAQSALAHAGESFQDIPIDLAPLSSFPANSWSYEYFSFNGDELRRVSGKFEETRAALVTAMNTLNGLSAMAGTPPPTSCKDVEVVIKLMQLRAQDSWLDPSWLSKGGLQKAREAFAELRTKVVALERSETLALSTYKKEILEAPVADLSHRFTHQYKGMHKVSGKYRSDKRLLSSYLNDPQQVSTGIENLPHALAWIEAIDEFESTTIKYSVDLGKFWEGRNTNWDEINKAFITAEEIITVCQSSVSPGTISFFTTESFVETHLLVANSASQVLESWTAELSSALNSNEKAEMFFQPIEQWMESLSIYVRFLESAISRVKPVADVLKRDVSLKEAEGVLEAIEKVHSSSQAIEGRSAHFSAQFGSLFRGKDTNINALEVAIERVSGIRDICSGALDEHQLKSLSASRIDQELSRSIEKWEDARTSIIRSFSPDRTEVLLKKFSEFRSAFEFLDELSTDTIGRQEWFEYKTNRDELENFGVHDAIEFCIDHEVSAADVPLVVEKAVLKAWVDAQFQIDNRLSPMLARDREALVSEYKDLDRELVVSATNDILRAAKSRRPKNVSIGEPGIIRKEGIKQRRHMPVRDLISQTKTVTQAIKPIFMMSPLAVSQLLPSDIKFDVVIFDEASQVSPGDAINCIYRGRACILAGDDKQLPPTRFFERSSDPDELAEDESELKDYQSILELAKSSGAFRNLGLRWHYRSRHESLIAFSNYKFYDGSLITYPSSQHEGDDTGVDFFLTEGIYRRGGGANNPVEAEFVASRVIHHYRTRPGLSLGVVTFSLSQSAAVEAALDKLRSEHRDLDKYFDKRDRLDGFFIRSLESVQGDERDVIIFSVGYGPDESGKISTNFGVLNKEKGWRRLNVGVTRARERVEVVASMEAEDIPPSQNENVEAFRAYLDFARRGIETLGTQSSTTGLMPDSPFEESVISVIRSWGYEVEPQVGAAGYRIDIGVRHPDRPGAYVIGVECDGYQYHSAPAARDRDRLREQVLVGLGWNLHRIWGTAWYRDRISEEARLREAIQSAVSLSPVKNHTQEVSKNPIRMRSTRQTTKYEWISPYKVRTFLSDRGKGDLLDAANSDQLIGTIKEIALVEGPVHLDVVAQRMGRWWFHGNIPEALAENIRRASLSAELHRDGEFVDIPNRPVTKVRLSTHYRKPYQVSLDEYGLATELLLKEIGSATRNDIAIGLTGIFGWTRRSASLNDCVSLAIDRAISRGVLQEDKSNGVIGIHEDNDS